MLRIALSGKGSRTRIGYRWHEKEMGSVSSIVFCIIQQIDLQIFRAAIVLGLSSNATKNRNFELFGERRHHRVIGRFPVS
jgi:hypothetical protein